MNTNTQKEITKIEELLNNRKSVFDDGIEYIKVNHSSSSVSINGVPTKAQIEIWKKLEDKQGLIYVGCFYVLKKETYKDATADYLENFY